jgi:hypothetical protein
MRIFRALGIKTGGLPGVGRMGECCLENNFISCQSFNHSVIQSFSHSFYCY